MSADRADRIHGALLGLAVGDAVGLAADYHRAVRSPWVRGRLWAGSAELDEARVAKPLLPFDATTVDGARLAPTDDTETAVLAARVALTTVAAPDASARRFAEWRRLTAGDDVWTGIAERSAIINAERGLVPPVTGNDGPADASDSAVAAGVVWGLFHAGDPAAAAEAATEWASITHARDGVWAAACMASAVSALAVGASIAQALDDAEALVPADSWLAEGFRAAARIAPASVLLELPRLLAELNPRRYSQPGTAPETLPIAFLLLRADGERPEQALANATLFARESDSVPAFVGALLGAAHGAGVFGEAWPAAVDRVDGVCYPVLAGERVSAVAAELEASVAARAAG